jgi:hypothetical protein
MLCVEVRDKGELVKAAVPSAPEKPEGIVAPN